MELLLTSINSFVISAIPVPLRTRSTIDTSGTLTAKPPLCKLIKSLFIWSCSLYIFCSALDTISA